MIQKDNCIYKIRNIKAIKRKKKITFLNIIEFLFQYSCIVLKFIPYYIYNSFKIKKKEVKDIIDLLELLEIKTNNNLNKIEMLTMKFIIYKLKVLYIKKNT